MSNERLEELAYNVAPTSDGRVVMSADDYDFLYEQAERARELEGELQLTEKSLEGFDKAYEKEKQQNKRYREALGFYANKDNYEDMSHIFNPLRLDMGHRAYRTLESESE